MSDGSGERANECISGEIANRSAGVPMKSDGKDYRLIERANLIR